MIGILPLLGPFFIKHAEQNRRESMHKLSEYKLSTAFDRTMLLKLIRYPICTQSSFAIIKRLNLLMNLKLAKPPSVNACMQNL